MIDNLRFAFIGGGNMAEALIKGLLSGLQVPPRSHHGDGHCAGAADVFGDDIMGFVHPRKIHQRCAIAMS